MPVDIKGPSYWSTAPNADLKALNRAHTLNHEVNKLNVVDSLEAAREETLTYAVTVNPLVTADTTPPLSGLATDPAAVVTIGVDGQEDVATRNGLAWNIADGVLDALDPGTYDVSAVAVSGGVSQGDSTTDELEITA